MLFSVTTDAQDFELMTNYEPFVAVGGSYSKTVFQLTVAEGEGITFAEELRQDDEGQVIVCGKTDDGRPVFQFIWAGETAGWLVCEHDYSKATLTVTGKYRKLALDNALMILFALATAGHGIALFHSSTVTYDNKAYMFLGVSGTGKSTHSSLWLKYIHGTELLNDDNPVVRVDGDDVTVYGSPWSGKTPCYRNHSNPLGGIVLLSQAPYNKIHRLKGIYAYVALVPSISGKRWDERIADGYYFAKTLRLIRTIFAHPELLDEDAAAPVEFE